MIAWSGPLSGLGAAAIRGTDEGYEVTAAGKRSEATESMNSEWQMHDRGRDLGCGVVRRPTVDGTMENG